MLCFFGFFWAGEITVPSQNFDLKRHLGWGNVAVDNPIHPTHGWSWIFNWYTHWRLINWQAELQFRASLQIHDYNVSLTLLGYACEYRWDGICPILFVLCTSYYGKHIIIICWCTFLWFFITNDTCNSRLIVALLCHVASRVFQNLCYEGCGLVVNIYHHSCRSWSAQAWKLHCTEAMCYNYNTVVAHCTVM